LSRRSAELALASGAPRSCACRFFRTVSAWEALDEFMKARRSRREADSGGVLARCMMPHPPQVRQGAETRAEA